MPVQKLNQTIRDEIYRRTLAKVQNEGRPVGNCLEFAWHGYELIKSWPGAPRTIIQAGSASWPRVPPELDDGVIDTHFSYLWNPDSPEAQLFQLGVSPVVAVNGLMQFSLPEMHVWLACPETQEVIDFTTSFWPAACFMGLGQEWLAPHPPRYLWDFGSRLPTGVKYLADQAAIELVLAVLERQEREYP